MSIVLTNLVKRYEKYPVVNNVSLEVGDGEFFVLLGSSGSGKTTILSLIAGLVEADSGRILLHGRDVTHLPVQQRNVGFVFQHYALFQHMTVADNVEFGLSIRKVPAKIRRRRGDELLELVGLAGLGKRYPSQLSGGQQQRVALARALAHQPDVLLLDEPLGALDAKIRIELRRTLKDIQRQLGIAAILVTHDQEEAFDIADRIGVMSYGRLLEVGTPEQLYRQPKTEFVATFLGTANLLVGKSSGGVLRLGSSSFKPAPNGDQMQSNRRVQVLFRPEDVALAASPEDLDCPVLGQGEVEDLSFSGSFQRLRLKLPPIPGVRPIAPAVAFGSSTIRVDASRLPDQADKFPLDCGSKAWIGVRRIHALEHPGLSFLILTDGTLRSQAALELGGQISRLAHARVTLLGTHSHEGTSEAELQQHIQEARKILGSGLAGLEVQTTGEPPDRAAARAVEKQTFDLVILGFRPEEDIHLAERLMQFGDHNLLLVPQPQKVPELALISVAPGEPGKEDIFFAGRLLNHLGARAKLITVLPDENDVQERAEQFLSGGAKTLELLNVPAETAVRTGNVAAEIWSELSTGDYELLVVGTPLPQRNGTLSFDGVLSDILRRSHERAVLVARSQFGHLRYYPSYREITKPVDMLYRSL